MFGNKPCFLTGSTVYGDQYRTEESDIDLVCFFEKEEYVALLETIDLFEDADDIRWDIYQGTDPKFVPIRFGRLNIIPVFSRKKWKLWKEATERATMIQPRDKGHAICIFNEVFGGPDR